MMKKISHLWERLPSWSELKNTIHALSKKEWYVFLVFAVIAIISGVVLLSKLNKLISTPIPSQGGTIVEGVVGTPRFVNPVLALSDADKDLVSLVFSGLMRRDGTGNLIPDLAKEYTVSDDGLVYTFTLKDKLYFHDGEPLSADDIVYTINAVKDPALKSPKKIAWDGVTIKKIDEKTVQFILRQPFASFLENTTIGILPSHLWNNVTTEQFLFSDLNIEAIGSGPYQVKKAKKRSGIVNEYDLHSFSKFALGEPYITHLDLKFYANEKDQITALEDGDVDQISAITGDKAREFEGRDENIQTAVLPRVFGLYFNQSQASIFLDKNVVRALDLGINRDRIIREVLSGYGVPIDSPIPASISDEQNNTPIIYDPEQASEILEKSGWIIGDDGIRTKTEKTGKKTTTSRKLSFSIATGDAPELKQAALLIKEDLSKIGIEIDLKVFDIGSLNQNIIRPRKYDALFFGQIVSRESDLYAFWHSSQRNDPGLNIAMYANQKVDTALASALITTDRSARLKKYQTIDTEIEKDKPALFIYSPNFIYVTAPNVHNIDMSHITAAAERFSTVYRWYIDTERVWNVFTAK